ncbi:MAG: hypothetical protein MJK08_10150 [Campylobacterales bacterium]|nr:hypothetical protein [Campylobacterales bacterium]
MNKSILNVPIIIFFISIIILIINTIFSIYFISIMLIGIIFLSIEQCIKNKQYYTLTFLIFVMLYLEINIGFRPFSLTLLAFFSHVLILPYIKRVMTLSTVSNYVHVLWFYLAAIFVYSINNDLSFNIILSIFFNIIIDFIVVGLFI